MSRIGNKSISIPKGVSVDVNDENIVTVKGPKGTLTQEIQGVELAVEDGELKLTRKNEQKKTKAFHGLYRSLINNMIVGVTEGYKITLEVVGVGFKATNSGNVLELSLGYSHTIFFALPSEVSVATETKKGKAPIVTIEGIDKQLVGQVVAKIKSLRKVEPYKGKGIRLLGEQIRRKAGKTAAKK